MAVSVVVAVNAVVLIWKLAQMDFLTIRGRLNLVDWALGCLCWVQLWQSNLWR